MGAEPPGTEGGYGGEPPRGFETEEALLDHFVDLFNSSDVHVVTGWNIHSYDFPQLWEIAHRLTAKSVAEWHAGVLAAAPAAADSAAVMELGAMATAYMTGEWVGEDVLEKRFALLQKKLAALWRSKRSLGIGDMPVNYVRKLQSMDHRRKSYLGNQRGVYIHPAYVQPHTMQVRVNRFNSFGCLSLDAYEFTKRDMKLRSYKLDAVAKELIGQKKDDMPYSQIADAYNSGYAGRMRIALYCAVDTALVTRLVESKKLSALQKTIHLSIITGAFPADLGWRGTIHQLRSCILRFCAEEGGCGYILPVSEDYFAPSWVTGEPDILDLGGDADGDGEDQCDEVRAPWLGGGAGRAGAEKREVGYQGATVCAPLGGFYTSPISTLDFAGLYPSIMLEKNLCMSSMLPSIEEARKLGFADDQVHRLSLGGTEYVFLKSEVFRGVVPNMLIALKKHRKAAKKKMASFKVGEAQHSYWDGVQASVKVIMNGTYGAFGTKKGGLFPKGYVIAALITSRGRELIELIKHKAETQFWVRGERECGILDVAAGEAAPEGSSMVRVVYGDTDSIFIDMKSLSRDAAATFSAKLSEWYNEHVLPRPHDLEFEKIFHPFMLYKKKMYSGIHYEAGAGAPGSEGFLAGFAEGAGKLKSKGIAAVRRDQVGFTKTFVKEALRLVLVEQDPERAEAYAQECIVKVRESARRVWWDDEATEAARARGELLSLEDFVESGSLHAKRQLEDYGDSAPAAVEVVRRLAKTNPDAVPEGGARVEFCTVAGPSYILKTKRAYSPEDARDKKMPLDVEHYLDVAMKKLCGTLYPVFAHKEREQSVRMSSIESFFGADQRREAVSVRTAKRKADRDKPEGMMFIEKKLKAASTGAHGHGEATDAPPDMDIDETPEKQPTRFVTKWDKHANRFVEVSRSHA